MSIGWEDLEKSEKNSAPGLVLPQLLLGDVRKVRLNKFFDAVTSLFHVMSYQNTEEDALAEFETARLHLRPGGIFLFDFWYGPGVLSDPPEEREKIMEDSDFFVHRHARPVHRINENIVEVHYTIELAEKQTGIQRKLQETHVMRYWFMPELLYLVKLSGFRIVAEGIWLQESAPSKSTWNAWMAVRK